MQYRGSCCPFSNVCTVCTIHWLPRLPSEFNNACGFAQSCRLDLHSKEYFQRILDDRSASRLLGMSRLQSFQTFCWPFLQFLPKCGLHVREQMLLQFNVVKGQGPRQSSTCEGVLFLSHVVAVRVCCSQNSQWYLNVFEASQLKRLQWQVCTLCCWWPLVQSATKNLKSSTLHAFLRCPCCTRRS